MNRLARWLCNAATLLALLLGSAASALWIRSHYSGDTFTRTTINRQALRYDQYMFESEDGIIHISHKRLTFETPASLQAVLAQRPETGWRHQDGITYTYASTSNPGLFERLGFARSSSQTQKTTWRVRGGFLLLKTDWQMLAFPHAVLTPTLLLPTWRVISLGRRKLRKKPRGALCPHCGYDLRATPTRCPECGTATSTAT